MLSAFIEVVLVVFRFGLKLESTRHTASTIGKLTFGVRIHHGYIGILMILYALLFLRKKMEVFQWVMPIGIALFLSDIIHHFIVLWTVVGHPQFDLVY